MCKKISKNTVKLLSGIMMSSVAVSLAETNSFANENTTALEQSVNNRSAVKTGVVTATALHVRSKADASSTSLGGLSKGDKVEIVDTASNGWYKIKYKTGYGYVSNKYVDVISTNTSSEYTSNKTTITHTGITTDGLNVRSGASTSYSKIGYLNKGTKVNIVDKLSNGWYKIKYENGYGYVSGKYVNNVTAVSSTNNNISTNTSTATTVKYTATVNTDSLNVRSGGSTSYSIIGKVTRGTKVNIVDKLSNGWYKIKYNDGYGYISGQYVNNVTTVSSTNDTSTSTTVKYTAIVNADFLNVREGGSVSYKIIGKVYDGEKVSIVDKMSNGWSKIKYGSGYGYVNTSYLSNITASSSSNNNATVIKTGTVNTDSLNVRKGSSTNYDIIGKVTRGTKVEIVKEESNGWYKIKYNGGYGYVSGQYINVAGERKNLNNFLFVGDSFTVLLSNTIKAKNDNVYIHAKSGSMPGYWIDKVSSMPSNSNVDGVVLLIGVNGAGYESNKTDVKTLINKLSAKYPNKTIYVQKVFPVGRAFTSANPYNFNQKIASLNSVIKSHCSTVSNAKFIDTTSGFVDSNGYLIHHNGDGLHIASSYNNQFYNNIFNAVKAAEK